MSIAALDHFLDHITHEQYDLLRAGVYLIDPYGLWQVIRDFVLALLAALGCGPGPYSEQARAMLLREICHLSESPSEAVAQVVEQFFASRSILEFAPQEVVSRAREVACPDTERFSRGELAAFLRKEATCATKVELPDLYDGHDLVALRRCGELRELKGPIEPEYFSLIPSSIRSLDITTSPLDKASLLALIEKFQNAEDIHISCETRSFFLYKRADSSISWKGNWGFTADDFSFWKIQTVKISCPGVSLSSIVGIRDSWPSVEAITCRSDGYFDFQLIDHNTVRKVNVITSSVDRASLLTFVERFQDAGDISISCGAGSCFFYKSAGSSISWEGGWGFTADDFPFWEIQSVHISCPLGSAVPTIVSTTNSWPFVASISCESWDPIASTIHRFNVRRNNNDTTIDKLDLSPDELRGLSVACPQTISLIIRQARLTALHFNTIAACFPSVKALWLTGVQVSEADIQTLPAGITRLEFDNVALSRRDIQSLLTRFPQISVGILQEAGYQVFILQQPVPPASSFLPGEV